MNIEKYISDLLYRYQCVTVPGFGAFLTEFKSAQINTENVILPPKKVLSFNQHLKNNDGLLANHIAQEENISYSEAILFIKNKVNDWQLAIDQNAPIALNSIGEINANKEGNLVFVPSNEVNFETNSFGLTEVVAPQVERSPLEELVTSSEAENIKPAVDLFAPTQTTQTEVVAIQPEVEVLPKQQKSTGIYKVAAVIAVFIGAGMFGYKVYNDSEVEKNTLALQKQVQDKVEQKVQEATFVMENPIPAVNVKIQETPKNTTPEVATSTISTSTTSKLPYHIIAGSFKSQENATNKVKDLKSKGYNQAAVVDKNAHGLLIVAYKSFSNLEQAKTELKNIQTQDNDQAWLLTK